MPIPGLLTRPTESQIQTSKRPPTRKKRFPSNSAAHEKHELRPSGGSDPSLCSCPYLNRESRAALMMKLWAVSAGSERGRKKFELFREPPETFTRAAFRGFQAPGAPASACTTPKHHKHQNTTVLSTAGHAAV